MENEINEKGICGLQREVKIETHENVSLQFEVAGIGSRFAADIIDKAIRVVFYLVVALVLFCVESLRNRILEFIDSNESVLEKLADYFYTGDAITSIIRIATIILLVVFVLRFSYHILFEIFMNGRTPGKVLCGTKVVSIHGEAPTASMIFIRNILRVLHMIPGGELLDGVIMLFSKNCQRVGDFAGKTMVIKTKSDRKFKKTVDEILEIENRKTESPENRKNEELNSEDEIAIWKKELLQTISEEEEAQSKKQKAQSEEEDAQEKESAFLSFEEYKMLSSYLVDRKDLSEYKRYDRAFLALISKNTGKEFPQMSENEIFEYLKVCCDTLKNYYEPEDSK